MAEDTIRVEVAYAAPERPWLLVVDAPPGTTAAEAVELSGIRERCPGIDASSLGVFGEAVAPDRPLEDGDRVEIYRPLTADPKEIRRELAKLGKTMKDGRS